MEIILVPIPEERRKSIQEFCDGNKKSMLYMVRNSRSVVQCHFGMLPKECDGMSVMEFCDPSMCSVVRGEML
jgi:hypothetical protein